MSTSHRFTLTLLGIGAAVAAGFAAGALFAQRPHVTIPPLDAVTTHGEWVKFANARGDSVRAYVAYPESADKAPAIIVVHEIFGLTDWEPTIGDRFAAAGYVAIVPDLLSSRFGDTASKRSDARSLVGQLAPAAVVADLNAAYDYVNAQPAVRKDDTGIIGFCWGGSTVWNYVVANPNLKAAVTCYGTPPAPAAMATIGAPVFEVYAEEDGRVTATYDSTKAIMARLGKPFTGTIYQGAGHGFLKPGRKGYGTAEYERAWKDIDTFLAAQLHVK